jgi:hypothetical protein
MNSKTNCQKKRENQSRGKRSQAKAARVKPESAGILLTR